MLNDCDYQQFYPTVQAEYTHSACIKILTFDDGIPNDCTKCVYLPNMLLTMLFESTYQFYLLTILTDSIITEIPVCTYCTYRLHI